ncbi:MAG: 1-acyl-sn-glycerol-3-phosphate acyltransferase [Myxococcota bacterium]|jgi:1-acyl-sn-glycerol-3-phosphate acyltransferase
MVRNVTGPPGKADWIDQLLPRFVEAVGSFRDTVLDPGLSECIDRVSQANLNDLGFDRFGYSPEYVKKALPAVAAIYRHYFRVKPYDLDNVPNGGRVMLVANHSGQLPFDGAMLGASLLLDKDPPRMARAMVERWVPTLPFASVFMARCGQVVGTPENCKELLAAEECILVFPEGSGGISKTFDKRYQLQRFGYGFMRLAIETGTPIIPVGVVGAEEQAPSLFNWEWAARRLGAPAVPITPLFPLLGPFSVLPLPVRYHVLFGEPMVFDGDPNDDEGVIGRKVKRVKRGITDLLERGLAERTGVFR